jgi:ABC-2 type transport system permease protein
VTTIDAAGPALQARLLANEIDKGLRLTWHRKGTVGTAAILGLLNYLGINLFIGGGHMIPALMQLTLPGLLAVTVAQAASMNGSGGIAEEVNGGTLEQTRLSPASAYLQVIGRMGALAIEGVLVAVVLAIVFTAWFGLDYAGHATAALPAVLTVLDALGYGLLMTAFTLRVASIGAIVHVFNMAIMFFGGMLVPVTRFPGPDPNRQRLRPDVAGRPVVQHHPDRRDRAELVRRDAAVAAGPHRGADRRGTGGVRRRPASRIARRSSEPTMTNLTTDRTAPLQIGAYFGAVGNEIHKGLRFAWAERLQILIELPMFAVFVLLLGPLLGQGNGFAEGTASWSLDSRTTSMLVVWFVPFTFFYMQVVKTFWRLLAEIQAGTIEQVFLSPLPSWLVVAAGRVLAAFLETVFVAVALYGIVSIFVPLDLRWNVGALVPLASNVVAAVGLSLIIAGATLVWKRIQLVNDAVLLAVMLFSASALPLIDVPQWWATLGHFFPLTDVTGSLYRGLLTEQSIWVAWGTGGMVPMIAASLGYLAAGVLAFRLGARTPKRRGSLGRY